MSPDPGRLVLRLAGGARRRAGGPRPEPLGTLIRRCAELHLRHRHRRRSLRTGQRPASRLRALGRPQAGGADLTGCAGEAVAIGLVLDSRYSVEAGLLPEADCRIERLIGRLGLPRWHDALLAPGRGTRPALFDGLDDFREHLGGDLTITLLRGIGPGAGCPRDASRSSRRRSRGCTPARPDRPATHDRRRRFRAAPHLLLVSTPARPGTGFGQRVDPRAGGEGPGLPGSPLRGGAAAVGRGRQRLAQPAVLAAFRDFLMAHDLFFTINGFPYGAFHRTAVKENVYRPDGWRTSGSPTPTSWRPSWRRWCRPDRRVGQHGPRLLRRARR